MLFLATACSQEVPQPEPTESLQQSIIAPGMLTGGYTPVVPNSNEVVALFVNDPLASLENLTIREGVIYATSILGGKIYVKDMNTPPEDYTTIPVDIPPGTFMGGITQVEDYLIFVTSTFTPELTADHGTIYKLDPVTEQYEVLTTIPGAALNGVDILDTPNGKIWISIDSLKTDEDLNGVIWGGSLQGGEAFVWYSGEAAAPNPDYTATTCNPPFAVGGNDIRVQNRFGQTYVVASNTTSSGIWSIPVVRGQAMTAHKWYDQLYPDGVWPDGCGIPLSGLPHGTWVSGHGLHETYWINPYNGERVLIADGTVCNGNTAGIIADGEYLMACATDPLICGPDENGDPDPLVLNPTAPPMIIKFELKSSYVDWCGVSGSAIPWPM